MNFADTDFDPFQAQVVREGTDATVVAYGPLVPVALAAAEAAVEDGRSIEVIDLRSISPMDVPTVAASVVKTGRLIVAHEGADLRGHGRRTCRRNHRALLLQPAGSSAACGRLLYSVPGTAHGGRIRARY